MVNRGPDANRYLGTLFPSTRYPPEHICNLRKFPGAEASDRGRTELRSSKFQANGNDKFWAIFFLKNYSFWCPQKRKLA